MPPTRMPLALPALTAALLTAQTAIAAPPLSPSAHARGIGLEATGIDTSLEINGAEVRANGTLGGIYAYLQRGTAFRAEGRLLAGSLDTDLGASGDSASVTLLDLQATLGRATASGVRLYGGLGLEHLSGDSPYGSGDGESWSIYAPIGLSRADELTRDWRVLVSLEARLLLAGRDEIDDMPGLGDGEFDRDGGWGLGVSAQFHNRTAGIDVEPWLSVTRPASSEVETVGGTDVQLEEADTTAGGVRLTWSF